MKNSIFKAVCKTRYLALLVVLIFTCGNAWGYTGTFTNYANATLIDGYYIICPSTSATNTNYCAGTDVSSSRITGKSLTSKTNPANAYVWIIENTASGWTFNNYGTSTKYIRQKGTSSGGGMEVNTTIGYFTLAGYNSSSPVGYKFTSADQNSNNQLKWNNSNKWFANYANAYSTSMTPVCLYRDNTKYRAKTTQPATGSFTASATSATWDGTKKHLSWMASGATVTLTATPPSGKEVNAWTVTKASGGTVTVTSTGTNTATFSMPADQVTVTVTWKDAASCTTNATVTVGSLKGSVSSSSSATAQCTNGITNIGGTGCSLTSYGFAVGTSTNPTIGGTLTGTGKTYEAGTSIAINTSFEKLIDGLSANTEYYVRPYATNGNGTAYGTQFNFTTLAACTAAPTVGAGSSSNVTKNTATVTCSAGITSLGTGGCAIESYGFVYGTSQNPTTSNNKVEVGTTYTTIETSFNANLTGLAEGQTYYVRPYATNGFGTAYGDQVTFGTPKITVVPAGLVVAFGDKKVGGTYTATFTVSGVNLQGNITITPNASCSGFFSVDKTSITPDNGTVTNEEITITYTPTTAGSHGGTAYINVESTNAQIRSVMPTGTGKWEVTWNNNGSTSTTLVANNEKPTFPSTPSSCDATSTTFYGWATAPWTNKIQSLEGKTVHIANSTMSNIIANGTTFYAVFAKSSGSEGSASVATDALKSAVSTVTSYTNVNFNITDAGSNNYQCSAHAIKCTSNGSQKDFMQVGKIGDNRYITIPTLPGNITNISSTTIYGTSGGFSGTIYYNTSASTTNAIATTGSLSGANSFSMDVTNGGTSGYLMFSTALCLGQLTISYSSASYSDYLTTCCENKVTLSAGSPSNGTVVFSPTGPIATCSATNSDRQTTVTVTPNAGYKLTGWTKAVSGIALPDSTNAISTSSDNTAAQSNTYTFAQNANGSMTVTATFTTMVDHFIDKLHNKTGYNESDNHAESGVYTVPNPGDASTPSPGDESCEDVHYKFVGWVPSSDVNASTGAVTSTANMIYGGTTGHAASDVTYWAVWAKEE